MSPKTVSFFWLTTIHRRPTFIALSGHQTRWFQCPCVGAFPLCSFSTWCPLFQVTLSPLHFNHHSQRHTLDLATNPKATGVGSARWLPEAWCPATLTPRWPRSVLSCLIQHRVCGVWLQLLLQAPLTISFGQTTWQKTNPIGTKLPTFSEHIPRQMCNARVEKTHITNPPNSSGPPHVTHCNIVSLVHTFWIIFVCPVLSQHP